MNNKNKFIILACAAATTFTGCKDESTLGVLPETVPMTLSMSNKYLAFGESTNIVMNVNQPEEGELALNENIEVEYTLQCKDADGNEIPYTEVFEGFTDKIILNEGDKQASMTLNAKSNMFKLPITSVLTAYSRGYLINESKQEFTLSDYHYTTLSLKGNSDKTIWEGEGFILQATTTVPAIEDVTIKVELSDEDKQKYPNVPEEVVIPAGKTESTTEVIWTEDSRTTTTDSKLILNFESQNPSRPLTNDNLILDILDVDKNKGTDVTDERYINPRPQVIYASSEEVKKSIQEWAPTKMVEVKTPGTGEHPTKSEWTFLRSMEFHHIDQCMNPQNKYGNYLVKGLGGQNTAKVQAGQGMDNNKFSTVTEEGYLKMWGVKERTYAEWWGDGAWRDYGISAFYANKFKYKNGNIEMIDAESQNVYILPGMRIEFRARINGAMNGYNNGIWLQGNIDDAAWGWPAYGEIDIVENLNNKQSHCTMHWGHNPGHPSATAHTKDVDGKVWNIYWCQLDNDGTIRLGINGKEILVSKKSNRKAPDPFNIDVNPTGYHILLTMLAPNDWSLQGGSGGVSGPNWDNGFANITYEQSKTHPDTPRMELDWIRFYKNSDYDTNLQSSKVGPLKNKDQVFY